MSVDLRQLIEKYGGDFLYSALERLAGRPAEVRYTYQENGRLQVTATLVGHEAKVTTEFERDNSLSDDDLMLWGECLAAEALRNAE